MNKEEAKEIIDKISKEEFPYALALAKAYEKLEQENNELSKMCELYSKSLYNAELKQLKERIDKAIYYINIHRSFSYDENCEILDGREIESIIKILKGDNNE